MLDSSNIKCFWNFFTCIFKENMIAFNHITFNCNCKHWPWSTEGACILRSEQFVSPVSLQFLQSITVIRTLLIRDWCVSCSQLSPSAAHHSCVSFAQGYVSPYNCEKRHVQVCDLNNNRVQTPLFQFLCEKQQTNGFLLISEIKRLLSNIYHVSKQLSIILCVKKFVSL